MVGTTKKSTSMVQHKLKKQTRQRYQFLLDPCMSPTEKAMRETEKSGSRCCHNRGTNILHVFSCSSTSSFTILASFWPARWPYAHQAWGKSCQESDPPSSRGSTWVGRNLLVDRFTKPLKTDGTMQSLAFYYKVSVLHQRQGMEGLLALQIQANGRTCA